MADIPPGEGRGRDDQAGEGGHPSLTDWFDTQLVERTRRHLTRMVEAVLDNVFDEPLDVRSATEARELVGQGLDPSKWGLPAAAAEWSLARKLATRAATMRGGRKLAAKLGSKTAGRAVLPITLAAEVGLAARAGRRELQVMASYLIFRLRDAGLPVEPDLVRRTVTACYLEPRARPTFDQSAPQLTAAVARKWVTEIVPGFGRRPRHVTDRIKAIEGVDLHRLLADWRDSGRRRETPSG